jgi:hypothetical protein
MTISRASETYIKGDHGLFRPEHEWNAGMTRTQRIQHYREHIYPHVEGWVDPDMWIAIEVLGEVLDEHEIRGNVTEFGVHHGRFLFLISCLRNGLDGPTPEGLCAIGIWDDPDMRYVTAGPGWSEMQHGSANRFMKHADKFLPGGLTVLERDTFSLRPAELRPAKFLSIDAGHAPENVINDLCLGQDVIVPGGIIALDDYLNPYWEGVTDGFYRFMRYHNRRLRPFMFFRNKLFLTTISEHRDYLRAFGGRMGKAGWCDLRGVAGHDCLVEKPR